MGNTHIDEVIEYMRELDKSCSANTRKQEIHEKLLDYKSEIETAYPRRL